MVFFHRLYVLGVDKHGEMRKLLRRSPFFFFLGAQLTVVLRFGVDVAWVDTPTSLRDPARGEVKVAGISVPLAVVLARHCPQGLLTCPIDSRV